MNENGQPKLPVQCKQQTTDYLARLLYSSVRVSISILSPMLMKAGMESKHGLWSALAVGDFDHDGDDDYIAGNLGLNNRFTINDQYPMRVYSIDLDKNGFIDPVSTAYWKDEHGVMQEYPINYLDEISLTVAILQKSIYQLYKV